MFKKSTHIFKHEERGIGPTKARKENKYLKADSFLVVLFLLTKHQRQVVLPMLNVCLALTCIIF